MSEEKANNSEQEDQLLDHEYDGIREYDNPLPGWWVSIFWGSIVFAFGYFFYFHILDKGDSISEEYVAEMAVFREQQAKQAMGDKVSQEGLEKLMANNALMKDADEIFQLRCQACHADKGQGKIGPNLTDDHWLHGDGSLMSIYEVIHDGVPAKGMPAWSRQLTPMELQKVTALVGTMRGKNIPGKPPEGEKVAVTN